MVSLNIMVILAIICSSSVLVPISCQRQDSIFKSNSDLSRNAKRSPVDPDRIVFRDDDLKSLQISSRLDPSRLIYESEISPQSRIANSNRRSRPKSDSGNCSERQRSKGACNSNGQRSESRHPHYENSGRNFERTSFSSSYESTRRISSAPSTDSITFPKEFTSYSVSPSRRRPSQKQNEPKQLQRNDGRGRDNLEVKPTVPTGDVPYSYLYKWIKQYHKEPYNL